MFIFATNTQLLLQIFPCTNFWKIEVDLIKIQWVLHKENL